MSVPVLDLSQRAARIAAARSCFVRYYRPAPAAGDPDACDFLAGTPQELPAVEYVEAIQRAVIPDSPTYFGYGPAWRPAVAAAAQGLSSRLAVDVSPDDVFLTRGVSSGLRLALRLVTDPGDEVMMMSPPWFFYEAFVAAADAMPVKVPLTPGAFDLDLPAIAHALTPRTRAVIINTPHNPSGRIFPEDQLRALAGLLEERSRASGRRIYVLSDEAYARILFDGRSMITPGRFYGATIMLHSYSKTLLAPSQRAGYMAIPPTMPAKECVRDALAAETIFTGEVPDTAMQHAMPELEQLSIDVAAIERRRDWLVSALRELGYELDLPEAGFYLFIRSPIPDAVAFCDRLAERKVYALPGEAFERPGYFRLSLTATDAMVDRALPVFAEGQRLPA